MPCDVYIFLYIPFAVCYNECYINLCSSQIYHSSQLHYSILKILNASPGFGAPLTEGEVVSFLTSSKLNIHIGTVDKKGESNIYPTWYYFDNTNNRFILKHQNSQKKQKTCIQIIPSIIVLMNLIYPTKVLEVREKSKFTKTLIIISPIAEKIMVPWKP